MSECFLNNNFSFVDRESTIATNKQYNVYVADESYLIVSSPVIAINQSTKIPTSNFQASNNATILVNSTCTFTGGTTISRKLYTVTCANIFGKNPNDYPGVSISGNYTYNGVPQQGVVLTSGTQEISGSKRFTNAAISLKNTNADISVNPTNNTLYWTLFATDMNNSTVNDILFFQSTSGNIGGIVEGIPTGSNNSLRTSMFGWTLKPDNSGYFWFGENLNTVNPQTNNVTSLGTSNLRWSQVYVYAANIETSDERVKSNIASIPDAVLDAWGEVQWSQFQMKDAIEKKGANARLHSGLIAQHIDRIFKARNLDATRYGLFCHDSWEAEDYDETIIDKEAVTETVTVVDKEAVYATRTVVISPAYTDDEGVEHPAETYEEQYEVSPEESHEEERVIEPEVSHVEHHHRDAGDLYSLRYEECFAMEAAYQRRRADRIEARLAAIEAKLG